MTEQIAKQKLLGISLSNDSEDSILEYVVNFVEKGKGQCFITTPNPEILVYANSHKPFADILNTATISLPDGIGIVVASALLGRPLKSRITGVDFMKNLCEKVANRPITVGFLGGKGDVALKTSQCLRKTYPKLKILVAEAGNPDDKTANMIKELGLQNKDHRGIDILFVGYGFPKQEEWIYQNLANLPVRVAMTVGGSFDIVSGSLPRAPQVLRSFGMEWFWRLLLQPSRITRQIKLLKFVWLVIKELRIRK